MSPNAQFPADLVTFTEEILNGKLHFLCSECCMDKCLLPSKTLPGMLTHSFPVHLFSTRENIRKPYAFLMVSVGIESVHWERMC